MKSIKYSIIYAVIRPEISERLSVGLIIVNGEEIDIRYSRHKLHVLQGLFTDKEYQFVSRVVHSMQRDKSFNTVDDINYMSRYSNNLIAVSPLQCVDIEPTEKNKDWLYKNYVYSG